MTKAQRIVEESEHNLATGRMPVALTVTPLIVLLAKVGNNSAPLGIVHQIVLTVALVALLVATLLGGLYYLFEMATISDIRRMRRQKHDLEDITDQDSEAILRKYDQYPKSYGQVYTTILAVGYGAIVLLVLLLVWFPDGTAASH